MEDRGDLCPPLVRTVWHARWCWRHFGTGRWADASPCHAARFQPPWSGSGDI